MDMVISSETSGISFQDLSLFRNSEVHSNCSMLALRTSLLSRDFLYDDNEDGIEYDDLPHQNGDIAIDILNSLNVDTVEISFAHDEHDSDILSIDKCLEYASIVSDLSNFNSDDEDSCHSSSSIASDWGACQFSLVSSFDNRASSSVLAGECGDDLPDSSLRTIDSPVPSNFLNIFENDIIQLVENAVDHESIEGSLIAIFNTCEDSDFSVEMESTFLESDDATCLFDKYSPQVLQDNALNSSISSNITDTTCQTGIKSIGKGNPKYNSRKGKKAKSKKGACPLATRRSNRLSLKHKRDFPAPIYSMSQKPSPANSDICDETLVNTCPEKLSSLNSPPDITTGEFFFQREERLTMSKAPTDNEDEDIDVVGDL